MKSEELLELIGEVDDDLLRRSELSVPKRKRHHTHRSQWAVAACYFLISAILFCTALYLPENGIFSFDGSRERFRQEYPDGYDPSLSLWPTTGKNADTDSDSDSELTGDSNGFTVDLSQYTPATVTEVDAAELEGVDASVNRIQATLAGEEYFWTDPDLRLFRGTVLSLQHLKIDCGQISSRKDHVKDCVLYSVVITVKIGEVYYGDVKSGDEISVYMNYIGELGISEFAKQIYGLLTPGAEGIFGVRTVGEDSYYTGSDRIFYYNSVAQSILTVFTMIETDGSVVFPFPYYQGNAFATLDDGEAYLRQKLEQYYG